MVNTLRTQYNKITGLPVGFHLDGRTDRRNAINKGFAFIQLSIGELVSGSATIFLPDGTENGNFIFEPKPHADDPADDPGRVNYDTIAGHLEHTIKDHHESAPTRELTQVEKDLNAQAITLAYLLGRINKPFKTLSLDITTDKDGFITHHVFKIVSEDGQTTLWAPTPHIVGLIQKPNEKPCALLQWFDAVNDLVAEVRCEVGTNELAGFQKIIANGMSKTRSYSAAQAETFLHETEAAEAAAEGGE